MPVREPGVGAILVRSLLRISPGSSIAESKPADTHSGLRLSERFIHVTNDKVGEPPKTAVGFVQQGGTTGVFLVPTAGIEGLFLFLK